MEGAGEGVGQVNVCMWPFGVWWPESISGDPLWMFSHLMSVCNNTISDIVMSYEAGTRS